MIFRIKLVIKIFLTRSGRYEEVCVRGRERERDGEAERERERKFYVKQIAG